MNRSFDNHHRPHRPEGEWGDHGDHAQQLDRSADHGYADRDRFADDRERYRRGIEQHDHWRHEGSDPEQERSRYHQGMYGMADAHEMAGFPRTNYGNTAANEPYPPSARQRHPEVWRGRNEDYDFWGRERHDAHHHAHHGAHHGDHPSLWQRVKGAFAGRGPKNYVRSDERIREDVCDHLTHHPYVDASDIDVTVREGEVTLSGTVDARMVKRAAEDACDRIRGIRDVHNHLRVRPATPATPTTPTTPTTPEHRTTR